MENLLVEAALGGHASQAGGGFTQRLVFTTEIHFAIILLTPARCFRENNSTGLSSVVL